MPAIGMYGELLRCFRQTKLGMKLVCTKVTWLGLAEMIEEALLDTMMRLHESGEFMDQAGEILDMVFESPLYSKEDLIRCFKTEKDQYVALLLQYLSDPEK